MEDACSSSYPLDPLLAISYRNHQKSLAYFSHLAPLVLFFFTKSWGRKRGWAWPNAPPTPPPIKTPLPPTQASLLRLWIKGLHNNYHCLQKSNKQQTKEVRRKTQNNRDWIRPTYITTLPSLSRDRTTKPR